MSHSPTTTESVTTVRVDIKAGPSFREWAGISVRVERHGPEDVTFTTQLGMSEPVEETLSITKVEINNRGVAFFADDAGHQLVGYMNGPSGAIYK